MIFAFKFFVISIYYRVPYFANRLKAEVLLCQDDQEKCYILGKRYLSLMAHVFRITEDKNYSRSLFKHDYTQVEQLVANLRDDLISRYYPFARTSGQ